MLLFSNTVFCLVCLLIFFYGSIFVFYLYFSTFSRLYFYYFFPAVTSCHKFKLVLIIISNFTGFEFESLLGFIHNVIRAFLNYFIALNVCNSPV